MAAWLYLKKAWLFVKEYWWAFVALALVGLGFLLGFKNSAAARAAIEALEARRLQAERDRKLVEEAQEKERQIKARAAEATKKLEEEFAEKNETVTKEMKKKVRELAEKAAEDPSAFGPEFAKEFGLVWENNND